MYEPVIDEIAFVGSVNYTGLRFDWLHTVELAPHEFLVGAGNVDPDVRAAAIEWARD